jgi:hypothetical protein
VSLPKFFNTASDRRQFPRTKLAEIAYIGMGPENGGLVLDVSDGGLSFHSVAPVQPAETIRFLLSLRGQSRIEGAGEVVWTNEMRTVCGLKFTSLSSSAREYINNWTNQSQMPAPAREKSVSPTPPASSQTEEPLDSLPIYSEPGADPLFAIPPAYDAAGRVNVSEPAGKSRWGGELFLWILIGILGGSLLGSAYLYGVHVGQSEIKSAPRPAAESGPLTESPTPAPAPAPAPTVSSEPASAPSGALVNTTKAGDAAASTSQFPGAEGIGAVAPGKNAQQAAEDGKSELAAAMALFDGDNGYRDPSKAVELLWAGVANGNSDAEVILAGLYITGNSVPKSCEQARSLLNAAVKSGNAQAKMNLETMKTNGCS